MPDIPGSPRVVAWKNAWESRDPARVVSLYARDATHASSKVAELRPELGRSELRGHAEIEAYAYLRHSNLDADNPSHVLELLEWREGMISAVQVFHF
jgi:nuclear transport factor 2 (NTF2) superfamily protein